MRSKLLVALLVLAALAAAITVRGVVAGAGQGADSGGPESAVPRLATESPFTLSVAEVQSSDLILKIEGIGKESVVEGDTTRLYGSTIPDALVTINGDVVPVTNHGLFYSDLKLEAGTNFIEVMASDFNGREASASFTVVSLQ